MRKLKPLQSWHPFLSSFRHTPVVV